MCACLDVLLAAGLQQIRSQISVFVCLYLSNRFLTSCLLVLFSAVPECHQPLGGSQTLWRRERWDTHAHRKQHSHTSHILMHPHTQHLPHFCMHVCIHSSVPWGTRVDLPMCALSEMISLFSQPFKPINTKSVLCLDIFKHRPVLILPVIMFCV